MSSNSLFRNLKNGAKYDALIKTDNCNKVYEGKGDTFFTIELMIKNIQENYKQAILLAPELKKQSLKETCHSIHHFLYWHFQYLQDEKPQMVRSLNCSWLERFTGIDCKSYSVVGGIILKQLGIKFYIRKIIQPGNNVDIGLGNYSHVYLIVPINQTTGSINQGYYAIDGTLPHTIEPFFIKEKSFFMDNKLPHYSLNGPGLYGEESEEIDYGAILSSVKNFIGKFIKDIGCIGGSAYNETRRDDDSTTVLAKLHEILANVNKATGENDMIALSYNVTTFVGVASWNASLAGTKRSEGYNPCSTRNIDAVHKSFNFYRYSVVPALLEWLNTYFIVNENGSTNFGRKSISGDVQEAYFGQWITYVGQDIVFTIPKYDLVPRGIDIPKFEVTQELADSINSPGSFNPTSFLQGLSTIIKSFQPNNGGSSGTGNGEVYDNNNPPPSTTKPSTSKAALGWVGALLLGGYAFTKMKDKPKVKPKTEK